MKRLVITLILVSAVWVEAITLKQSSTQEHLVFLMVDSTDHVTGKTGLSPTVTLSKNAGSFSAASGAVTEIANGWYKVAGNATDTNTLGILILHATGTAADPTDIIYEVVAYDPQDAGDLGMTSLDATISSRMATYTQPTGFLSATFPSGTVANTTNITAGTITTATNLTNLPTIPANWITAAGITAAALNGKGDWNIGKTGYSLTVAPLTGAQTATAVWTDTTAGDFTTALSIGKSVMNGVTLGTGLTINAYTGNTVQTGDSYTRIGAAGAGLTAIGDTRVANLDATVSSRLATSGYTAPPSAGTVSDSVWDEVLSGHLTAGTTGNALNAAGAAGDPWSTTLPGAYGAGTAGKIIGDNINATISSRSTYAGTDTTGTTTLLSRLTSGRATNLDNLDASISSRSTYAGGDTSGVTTLLTRLPSALTITTGKVDINDKTGFSLTSTYDPATVDILGVTLPDTYTGQQAGNLIWRTANKP